MTYKATMEEISNKRKELLAVRKSIRDLQDSIEPEPVSDYIFSTCGEDVSLASLFGDRDTLFVIHNMGKSCTSCTMWADGLNGVLSHLENRAAFVVASPDHPAVQKEFGESRDWKFRMVSHAGTSFADDMGYLGTYNDKPSFWPGVSVFMRKGDEIVRVSDTEFGSGDDFNPALNLFELIPGGSGDWDPQYSYG
ncbi:MAG: DUF899 family protein [bacterium]|nr:DUF899 domain-containing protein [Gammaproteobacteria bacterium]HIL95380.1 DUF899 domain-containing protein [Pseudomonadales bacterium]